MKSFKTVMAILLTTILVVSVCACSSKQPTKPTSTTSTTSTKTTSSTTKTTTSKTEESEWDWSWQEDKTIVITKYKGTASKVTVPSKINGTAVTALGSWTFRENKELKEVIIPDSVTILKQNLFMNCSNLEKVTLPKKVTEFGDQLFEGCSSIKIIVVPEGVTKLEYREFARCTSLEEIVLPAIDEIGEAVFSQCSQIKKVYYRGTETQWSNIKRSKNGTPEANHAEYEHICNYKGN